MEWRWRSRMKKTFGPAVMVALSLFGVFFLSAQEKPAPSYSSKTELAFKSCLFEAERSGGWAKRDSEPAILLVAKIYESGLAEEASLQLESLKNFFRLPDLRLTEESPETEITWVAYKEIYDEKGKFVNKEEEKSRAKIRKTTLMNGEEYTIFLIPKEINTKDDIFKFVLEVYKTQSENKSSSLVSMDLISKKDILWNFGGPLAVGFFFDQKAYFLTLTIRVSISSFGGSLGAGLTWVI
jgi:hypothetical protein